MCCTPKESECPFVCGRWSNVQAFYLEFGNKFANVGNIRIYSRHRDTLKHFRLLFMLILSFTIVAGHTFQSVRIWCVRNVCWNKSAIKMCSLSVVSYGHPIISEHESWAFNSIEWEIPLMMILLVSLERISFKFIGMKEPSGARSSRNYEWICEWSRRRS